jgi:superfamily I DNA and/or RNA helicase/very-short-patch-repair endonuclease
MTLEEHLGIWTLNGDGKALPLSYPALRGEIERLRADEPAYKIIERLEDAGFTVVLTNGSRVLSEKGLAKRIPLPARAQIVVAGSEPPWQKFRRLCHYYADCVHHSERSQEYLFDSDLDNKFFFPMLPIGWLKETTRFELPSSRRQAPALTRIRTRRDDDEDIYIGYPLSAFHGSRGGLIYSPLILIPVDFTYTADRVFLKIRHDEIDINRAWVEYNVRPHEQKDFMASICSSEGENCGLLNMELALQYLANRFESELNPNYLDLSPAGAAKILNKAALFAGTGLQYSKTLKKELRQIAAQPASVLDKTALAFVFREPPLENKFEREEHRFPLDFLQSESNTEQHNAVAEALDKPVSKVTGPPGTGKSQVAVNLIANLVFAGKSVLFTSKNHKAIHAIWERSQHVLPGKLPLLQFCTNPNDDTAGAVWVKQDIERLVGDAVLTRQQLDAPEFSLRDVEQAQENLQDFHEEITEIEFVRRHTQYLAAAIEHLRKSIPLDGKRLYEVSCQQIEEFCAKIFQIEAERSRLQKIIDWLLRRQRRTENAEATLRTLLPEIAQTSKTAERLKERSERLCANLRNYNVSIQEAAELEKRAAQLRDYSETLKQLTDAYKTARQKIKDAFTFKRAQMIMRIHEETPEVQQKLKDAISHLARQNLPFLMSVNAPETLELAQNTFVQFAKFFPAWAVTLLSLTKASPCVVALFDKVIIDEASQCEIPPVIPALFRAKGATIIGDPAQFPPVITLRENRHAYIRLVKHKLSGLEDERYDFRQKTAYDIIQQQPVLLREHFRCHEEIADYFNGEYYGAKLKVRTVVNFPANCGFRAGRDWLDVRDSLEGEIKKAEKILEQLEQTNFDGTIGVITPFRKLADNLRTRLNRFEGRLSGFESQYVNTVNAFQGGERDLIIFILALNSETERGQEWYATAGENRYIYNVAASRAKACLLIVGDRERARQSSASALRKLAEPPRPRRQKSQSPVEEKLYTALLAAGFAKENLVQQYPLAGRYLDIALVAEKIDIEVDGEAFHLNTHGERKPDDVFRDIQIAAAGWRVCRLWAKEVQSDLANCIVQVREFIHCSNIGQMEKKS